MKLLHSLRSFRSTASVCDSEPSPRQWTSRFNPFSRWRKTSTNEDADSDVEEPSPTATLPPSTFDDAFSPFASSANSRPPSTTGSLSPVSSFGTSLNAFGAAPRRHGSVYSHRSLSIKRDASRPPSAIPRAPLMPRPPTPKESEEEEEEEGLVLTATVCRRTLLPLLTTLTVPISHGRCGRAIHPRRLHVRRSSEEEKGEPAVPGDGAQQREQPHPSTVGNEEPGGEAETEACQRQLLSLRQAT